VTAIADNQRPATAPTSQLSSPALVCVALVVVVLLAVLLVLLVTPEGMR